MHKQNSCERNDTPRFGSYILYYFGFVVVAIAFCHRLGFHCVFAIYTTTPSLYSNSNNCAMNVKPNRIHTVVGLSEKKQPTDEIMEIIAKNTNVLVTSIHGIRMSIGAHGDI